MEHLRFWRLQWTPSETWRCATGLNICFVVTSEHAKSLCHYNWNHWVVCKKFKLWKAFLNPLSSVVVDGKSDGWSSSNWEKELISEWMISESTIYWDLDDGIDRNTLRQPTLQTPESITPFVFDSSPFSFFLFLDNQILGEKPKRVWVTFV